MQGCVTRCATPSARNPRPKGSSRRSSPSRARRAPSCSRYSTARRGCSTCLVSARRRRPPPPPVPPPSRRISCRASATRTRARPSSPSRPPPPAPRPTFGVRHFHGELQYDAAALLSGLRRGADPSEAVLLVVQASSSPPLRPSSPPAAAAAAPPRACAAAPPPPRSPARRRVASASFSSIATPARRCTRSAYTRHRRAVESSTAAPSARNSRRLVCRSSLLRSGVGWWRGWKWLRSLGGTAPLLRSTRRG